MATSTTIIKSNGKSPSRVTSPPLIRSGQYPTQFLAQDIDNLSYQINQLNTVLANTTIPTTSSTPSPSTAYSTIDPRQYGAVANGVADDSAAISSAIAQGGLYLQSGLVFGYTWAGISAAVADITNNGWLCSGGGTLKLLSGGTSALSLTGAVIRNFENVTINGNEQCGANPVIAMATGGRVYMRNVIVYGGTSGQYAITLSNMVQVLLNCVDVSAESPDGLLQSGTTTCNAIFCPGIPDGIGNW